MHVGLLTDQHSADFRRATGDRAALVTQVGNHVAVCIEDLQALVVRNLRSQNAAFIDGQDHTDSVFHAGPHIVFTECGSLVNEAGTIRRRHVVGSDDRPTVGAGRCAFCTIFRSIKEIVDRVVVKPHQLRTLVRGHNLRVFAQFLGVSGNQVCRNQHSLPCQVARMISSNLN